jgi:UDP-N-acetyl-D-mannosaminuronate dehydrogenase
LLANSEDRKARVGIIGLGSVGLRLARAFASGGFPLLGFDIDPSKVVQLQRGGGSEHLLEPPLFPELTTRQQEQVVEALRAALKR